MNRSSLLLLALTGLLCACGRSRSDASPPVSVEPAASVTQTVTEAGSSTGKSDCPRTGKWALCSVEKRLVQAGFVVRYDPKPTSRRPGFSVLPAAYNLGRSRLEVFVYPSAEAAARDVAGLDTLVAAPRGSRGAWGLVPPTFVRNGNMIAVFLTDSPVHGDRLNLALTAGAPQP
jgi:hypothetical protein